MNKATQSTFIVVLLITLAATAAGAVGYNLGSQRGAGLPANPAPSQTPLPAELSSPAFASPSPTASPNSASPAAQPTTGSGGVMCALDVKECPDGSFVARSGPKCEFVACPKSNNDP